MAGVVVLTSGANLTKKMVRSMPVSDSTKCAVTLAFYGNRQVKYMYISRKETKQRGVGGHDATYKSGAVQGPRDDARDERRTVQMTHIGGNRHERVRDW